MNEGREQKSETEIIRTYLAKEQAIRCWVAQESQDLEEEGIRDPMGENFWEIVKDCTLFCLILQKHDPKLMPFVKKDVRPVVRSRHNLLYLIDAGRELGIDPSSEFKLPDIFNSRNIPKVVNFLEDLIRLLESRPGYQGSRLKRINPSRINPLLLENFQRNEDDKSKHNAIENRRQTLLSNISTVYDLKIGTLRSPLKRSLPESRVKRSLGKFDSEEKI